MRSSLTHGPVAIGFAAVLILAACANSASNDDSSALPAEESQSQEQTRTTEGLPSEAASIPSESVDVVVDQPLPGPGYEVLPPERDLWFRYGEGLANSDEAEYAASLAELAAMSDLVVIGRIHNVTQGRLVDLVPDSPSARLQFVNYELDVSRASGAKRDSVSFELPINVTSEALEAAVQQAIAPHDRDGDGAFSDAELSASYDADAVKRAYDEYWGEAVELSVADALQRAPENETIFLLRAVDSGGEFRPVNGDSVIVSDSGAARSPWREGSGELESYRVAVEVSELSFDEVAGVVFEASEK